MNSWKAGSKPASETYFSVRASRAIQRAFTPVKTETLAKFIFSPTLPRIPSKAFSTSLVLRVTSKLMHTGLSDPQRAFRAPTLMYEPRTECATVDLALTPLQRVSGAVVGVVSASGESPNSSVMLFSEALNRGVQRGRFVYDADDRRLVAVFQGLNDDSHVVVSIKWFNRDVRERFFFAIPRRQYSFHDMPKTVLVALTNLEHRISQFEPETREDGDNTAGDPLFEFAKSNDGMSVQKTDAFDMSDMTTVVESLAASLAGVYYGPNLKRDVLCLSTGELSSRASGKMLVKLTIPDGVGQSRIRRMAAQDYFLRMLPPGSERWFTPDWMDDVSWNADAEKGLMTDVVDGQALVVGKWLVGIWDPLLPDLVVDSGARNAMVAEQHTSVDETGGHEKLETGTFNCVSNEELRKVKDEQRRMRNRLSAARSNQRRKERETRQKRELEDLKQRKATLEKVQKRLVDENISLRKRAESLV